MENRDPLGMSLMAHNLNRRRWSDWGLVPGPVDFDEPSFSYDMQDPIAEYRASMVAEVALSIPGVERTYVGCQAGGTGGPDGQATAVLTRPRDDAILMMKSIRPALVGSLYPPTVHHLSCSTCGWPSGASSRRFGYTRQSVVSTSPGRFGRSWPLPPDNLVQSSEVALLRKIGSASSGKMA
jgi:hypothetical protein